eukprot:CAMPEP_0182434788 /NCGR_PEP_ID=MMETSP1167-20130531/71829_1 /TAXON_ID=2988 /ORGANISM="Mallomonas Sp, Strain CCMP3275" /LENGTH=366 /DNA_ID=CAMNT_0024625043 /DNA_START=69 /DNA_END=1166 /DNA_ORIENTATION=+
MIVTIGGAVDHAKSRSQRATALVTHLLGDFSAEGVSNEEVLDFDISLFNLWKLKQNPYASKSNTSLDSVCQQSSETRDLANGSLLLDLTVNNNRDLLGLLQINELNSNIGLLFSTGPILKEMSESDLTENMTKELLMGVTITRSRAGVDEKIIIKPGAISYVISSLTELSSREITGLLSIGKVPTSELMPPIFIETSSFATNHTHIITTLQSTPCNLKSVILCNILASFSNLNYIITLLESCPCKICIDHFGNILQPIHSPILPHDDEIIDTLYKLCEQGYLSRIILSISIKFKIQLLQFGGPGYNHIEQSIIPKLQRKGFSDDSITALVSTNLIDVLAWYNPPPIIELPPETLQCNWCLTEFIPG